MTFASQQEIGNESKVDDIASKNIIYDQSHDKGYHPQMSYYLETYKVQYKRLILRKVGCRALYYFFGTSIIVW